tara:strand:+ start:281 stop:460 length:180 start_codon:yes stop_codon:yes gene_type:complete
MSESREHSLTVMNNTLMAKLSVRNCQYKIALEGLKTIKDSTDPMGIARQTLEAMEDCLP